MSMIQWKSHGLKPPTESPLTPVKIRGMVLHGDGFRWPELRSEGTGVRLLRELKAFPGARKSGMPGRVVTRAQQQGPVFPWPETDRPSRTKKAGHRLRAWLEGLVKRLSARASQH